MNKKEAGLGGVRLGKEEIKKWSFRTASSLPCVCTSGGNDAEDEEKDAEVLGLYVMCKAVGLEKTSSVRRAPRMKLKEHQD